jgi:hypothetical protein
MEAFFGNFDPLKPRAKMMREPQKKKKNKKLIEIKNDDGDDKHRDNEDGDDEDEDGKDGDDGCDNDGCDNDGCDNDGSEDEVENIDNEHADGTKKEYMYDYDDWSDLDLRGHIIVENGIQVALTSDGDPRLEGSWEMIEDD